jgi:CheY-like chemotaxis protein
MEQELIDSKERAEQSDKLKSAFIANMSHEIRTHLNAIVGFSRIIADTQNSEERLFYYSIVEENNTRLLGLINEILDISKIESGIVEFNTEPMSLYALCQDIFQTNSLRCAKDTTLILDNCDQNLIINGDKNRLAQVLNNLIGNAIKFTKRGSIRFGYVQKPEHIEFHVKDTGAGIDIDKIDRVFERFIKADNYTQGTGLGLSICKSIIEKMDGKISVKSKLGVGSCFTFTLPTDYIIKHVANNEISDQKEIEQAEKNRLILIAEDTDSNYILLEAMIGNKYTLKRARNGLEAVKMYEELHPDLILMDIKMDVMNGLEAAKAIRALSSDVPIIAQSAFAFEEDRKKSIESGCNDFLAKPFKKKRLIELIRKYLN